MKKGYLFAALRMLDAEYFAEEYLARVVPLLKRSGARIVASSDRPEIVEGATDRERVVLIEFDSFKSARDFYHGTEYQAVIQFRFNSADAHVYIMEALD
ncbi:DUF1330 domain-containing protein [Variovorax paradoxus]|uniref:DUF1330 domain-containing protein n=1 Tax=Variovorax paradoxus TaxID=34073 RepID=UPI003D65C4B4